MAKELGLRPMEVLTTWTCEELLVAYGVYANAHSKEGYDMMTKADRRKKKLTPLDRWAMPFFTYAQMEELSQIVENDQKQSDSLNQIAEALFS